MSHLVLKFGPKLLINGSNQADILTPNASTNRSGDWATYAYIHIYINNMEKQNKMDLLFDFFLWGNYTTLIFSSVCGSNYSAVAPRIQSISCNCCSTWAQTHIYLKTHMVRSHGMISKTVYSRVQSHSKAACCGFVKVHLISQLWYI